MHCTMWRVNVDSGPDILLNTVCTPVIGTCNLCASSEIRYRVSRPYKTLAKSLFCGLVKSNFRVVFSGHGD